MDEPLFLPRPYLFPLNKRFVDMPEKFGWDASKGRYAAIPQQKRIEPPKKDWTKIEAYRKDLKK